MPSALYDIPSVQQYMNLTWTFQIAQRFTHDVAEQLDNALPFGHVGNSTKTERSINAETPCRNNIHQSRLPGYASKGSALDWH